MEKCCLTECLINIEPYTYYWYVLFPFCFLNFTVEESEVQRGYDFLKTIETEASEAKLSASWSRRFLCCLYRGKLSLLSTGSLWPWAWPSVPPAQSRYLVFSGPFENWSGIHQMDPKIPFQNISSHSSWFNYLFGMDTYLLRAILQTQSWRLEIIPRPGVWTIFWALVSIS